MYFCLVLSTFDLVLLLAVIDECRTTMEDIRYLAERCRDILLYRIEFVLEEMTKVQLYDLPTDEPVTTEKFLQMIEASCQTGAQTLAKYGLSIIRFFGLETL